MVNIFNCADIVFFLFDETGDGPSTRRDPWEVFVAAPQRRSRSSHSRTDKDMKCSVFNCSTGATTFYVKCKNCSRIFCQRCTSSSISARRCYKRPRGHSFVFIPCSDGANSSANNNQVKCWIFSKLILTALTRE